MRKLKLVRSVSLGQQLHCIWRFKPNREKETLMPWHSRPNTRSLFCLSFERLCGVRSWELEHGRHSLSEVHALRLGRHRGLPWHWETMLLPLGWSGSLLREGASCLCGFPFCSESSWPCSAVFAAGTEVQGGLAGCGRFQCQRKSCFFFSRDNIPIRDFSFVNNTNINWVINQLQTQT